jgi:hypothetical protein
VLVLKKRYVFGRRVVRTLVLEMEVISGRVVVGVCVRLLRRAKVLLLKPEVMPDSRRT